MSVRWIASAIMMFISTLTTRADVTGRILGEDGKPCPGVSLVLLKAQLEAVTDSGGRFRIRIASTRVQSPEKKPRQIGGEGRLYDALGRLLRLEDKLRTMGIRVYRKPRSTPGLDPQALAKPGLSGDSLVAFFFGYENLGVAVPHSGSDLGDITLQVRQGLRSRFLGGDSTFDNILAGQVYVPILGDSLRRNSPPYRMLNAFKMLGYNMLRDLDPFTPPLGLHVVKLFQSQQGLPATGQLDRAALLKLDSLVWLREKADIAAAWRFPSFPHFMAGPAPEPPKEHLAMLLEGFFSALPADLIGFGGLGRNWNVDQFRNSIAYGLGNNLGVFFNSRARREYTPQEWFDLDSSQKVDFVYCAKPYYETYVASNSCGETPSGAVDRLNTDLDFIGLLTHEFGHGVGTGNEFPDSNGVLTRADFLFGRISFAKDPDWTGDPNDSLPRRRPDWQGEFLGNYAARNSFEDFAESFQTYFMQGKVFRMRAGKNIYLMQKYQFLKEKIFHGREYDTGDVALYNKWLDTYSELPHSPMLPRYFEPDFQWDYEYPLLKGSP